MTLTVRPPRRTYRGRAGANEMLTLTTWTRRDIGRVRLRGFYDVYCGMGGEHRRPVDLTDFTDRFVGADPDDVMDTLAAEWLAWDYTGCDCEEGP